MASSDKPSPAAGLGLIGAGVAACGVCCAGPILGFLAATGIASVLGAVIFGVAGFLVVLAVAGVVWTRRRRRAQTCDPAEGSAAPTPVAAPQLKTRTRT
jgi:hypothetical protein